MNINQESARQPDVVAMLARLDAYCAALYPPASAHTMDLDALCAEQVVFLVARDEYGQALGCAALVRFAAYAELKRMFVDPALRGHGVGIALLDQIALRAGALGHQTLMLETGVSQTEAIGLYLCAGFEPCAPFGQYQADPQSIFMRKALAGPTQLGAL